MIHHVQIGTADLYALQIWPVQQLPAADVLRTHDEAALAAHHARHPALSHRGGTLLNFTLHAFLIRHAGRTLLVDTGEPVTRNGAVLDWGLATLGVTPDDIDLVFLTHRDDDHVGGVLTPGGQPRFPRARYLMARHEAEGFQADPGRADQWRTTLGPLQDAGRLDLLDDGAEISPGLTTLPTPGHRPGATSLHLQDGGHSALLLADTLHVPLQVTHPDWSSVWDADPDQAAHTRTDVLTRAETQGGLLAVPHIPGAFGTVNRDSASGLLQWAPAGAVLSLR